MIRITIVLIFALTGCINNDPTLVQPTIGQQGNGSNDDWLIPVNEVFDGGPGKDGIPSIDNPIFTSVADNSFIADTALVLLARSGSDVKIYPHQILDWHEIVNDFLGEEALALTYCPLTGSGIGWDRNIESELTTFGVSGSLYNTNLLPYDRESNSTWSQLRMDCVNGERIGTKIRTLPLVETKWITAKTLYPEALVLSRETGFNRPYGNYPYGDYMRSNQLIFPVAHQDNRIHKKERVYALISEDKAEVFRFKEFKGAIKLHAGQIGSVDYIVVGSEEMNFMIAFIRPDTQTFFSPVAGMGEIIMMDSMGNSYNVFGEVVSGPDAGSRLESPTGFIAYWFSVAAFYPEVLIYGID